MHQSMVCVSLHLLESYQERSFLCYGINTKNHMLNFMYVIYPAHSAVNGAYQAVDVDWVIFRD